MFYSTGPRRLEKTCAVFQNVAETGAKTHKDANNAQLESPEAVFLVVCHPFMNEL